jgi:hypothetical protein
MVKVFKRESRQCAVDSNLLFSNIVQSVADKISSFDKLLKQSKEQEGRMLKLKQKLGVVKGLIKLKTEGEH